jgi:glycosyltransferase domain-containing protein
MFQSSTISILVPTYERHNKLSRLLSYLECADVQVFVADGSANAYMGKLSSNVKYFHLPSISYVSRVVKVLELIQTPNVSLVADDDFVDPRFLFRADVELLKQPECSAIFGRCYAFREDDATKWLPIYKWAANVEHESSQVRLRIYFSRYFPLAYAVTRTNLLLEAFQATVNLENRAALLIELMQGARLVAAGKVIMLDGICAGREVAKIQRPPSVFPELSALLSESPQLEKEMNELLANWTGTAGDDIFNNCIYIPYYKQFIPWHTRKFASSCIALRLMKKVAGRVSSDYKPATAFQDEFELFQMQNMVHQSKRE